MGAEPAASWEGFLVTSAARRRGHPCLSSIPGRGPFKLRAGFPGGESEETVPTPRDGRSPPLLVQARLSGDTVVALPPPLRL